MGHIRALFGLIMAHLGHMTMSAHSVNEGSLRVYEGPCWVYEGPHGTYQRLVGVHEGPLGLSKGLFRMRAHLIEVLLALLSNHMVFAGLARVSDVPLDPLMGISCEYCLGPLRAFIGLLAASQGPLHFRAHLMHQAH